MNAPRDLAAVWATLQPPPAAEPAQPFDRLRWQAETAAQAEATGEPLHRIAGRRCLAMLLTRQRAADLAAEQWRAMPLDVRELLLTMAAPELTETRRTAAQAWGSFTEAQRRAIGAFARYLGRELQGSRWLT